MARRPTRAACSSSMTGVNNQGAQWGTAVYENTFVKDNGVWKIASVHVYPRMATDYTKGWAQDAIPMRGRWRASRRIGKPTQVFRAYPAFYVPPFHFANPAKGAAASCRRSASCSAERRQSSIRGSLKRSDFWRKPRRTTPRRTSATPTAITSMSSCGTTRPTCSRQAGAKELSYIGLYTGRERIRKSLFTRYGNAGAAALSWRFIRRRQPLVTCRGGRAVGADSLAAVPDQQPVAGDGSYIAGSTRT